MFRIIRRSLAGHSKWANIRHKKGGKDAAKADQFQKLAKVIETSSRLAGGDRSHPALASALSRAKDARSRHPSWTREASAACRQLGGAPAMGQRWCACSQLTGGSDGRRSRT